VDRDAPDEVKDFLRHYYIRYSGPAGLTEQDDMENWNYATSASAGEVARRHFYNYSMGIGKESEIPFITSMGEGIFSRGISEQNQRSYYKRWSEFISAANWMDLR